MDAVVKTYKGVKILETPMYPCKYKADISGCGNSTYLYHRTIKACEDLIDHKTSH